MATCASDANKGLFNGTFWAIFMSSNIVGYLMSAFVIGAVKNLAVFFIVMTGICVCSSLFFLLLRQPVRIANDGEEPASKEESPSVVQTWRFLTARKIRPLLPIFVVSGYSVALFSAQFIPYMTSHMSSLNHSDTQ